MSDQTNESATVTERDARLRERAAFEYGASLAHTDRNNCEREAASIGVYDWTWSNAKDRMRPYLNHPALEAKARELYPLPKVKRPRVVADPHGFGYWKVATDLNGAHLLRSETGCALREWVIAGDYGLRVSEQRIRMWADLLANPTELVDVECDSGSGS